MKDFFPELKERGLASAPSAGTVTAIVKTNRLRTSSTFFNMKLPPASLKFIFDYVIRTKAKRVSKNIWMLVNKY
ncbi:hypothetical protein KCTCHS21_30170 [Cohnella abietis]|uniref:Uncharacterized protein n=1 Tax=Cohnella abietis TaxID=2507935 RepID=A0A3T1D6A9_9BACL|nr:hypothetical protein KCTCHS21_30170 [Cohnella abietis]